MNATAVGDDLAWRLNDELTPHGFRQLAPVPEVEGARVVAIWKRKTWNTNRGVVVVAVDDSVIDPGEYARLNRRRFGKLVGYIPLLYEVGLQVVLVGPDLLQRAARLNEYVDQINTQWVVLQSIHVVDAAAGPLLAHLPDALDPESRMKPAIQRFFEAIPSVWKLLSANRGFDPMKLRFEFSRETGRAALSARTWALWKSGSFIDAIEAGINGFVHQSAQSP